MNIILSLATVAVTISFWLLGSVLALAVGYLLLLTVAAFWAPKRTAIPPHDRINRFVFLVPAHNEEQLLPKLLKNLGQLDYPQASYAVHVVADNCTDRTAEIARRSGAVVHERIDATQIGKGYALQWLLEQLKDSQAAFEAAVILDADSLVSLNFLSVMNAHLNHGERVMQAYYAVLDPVRSWAVSLRAAALAVVHYLRPQGRTVLGGSVGLKGNGMVFDLSLLQDYRWSASITEDIDYHMSLLLAGERVAFAPDAIVWAEMPASLRDSTTQNVRWEQGRLEMARHYVPTLLRTAWQRKGKTGDVSSFALIDAAIEHLIPPFAVLIGLSLLTLLMALGLRSTPALALAGLIFVGQTIYLISGLVLAGSPRGVYIALFFTPLFLFWKLWLYLRVLLGVEQQGWVRTARTQERE